METIAVAEARNRLSEIVTDIQRTHLRVGITRHGQTAAVLISADDLAALEETVEILSLPGSSAAISEGLADLGAGRVADNDAVLRKHRDGAAATARELVTPDAVRAQLAANYETGFVRFTIPADTSDKDRRAVQKRVQQVAYANGFAGNYRVPYEGDVLTGYPEDPSLPRTPRGQSRSPRRTTMSRNRTE